MPDGGGFCQGSTKTSCKDHDVRRLGQDFTTQAIHCQVSSTQFALAKHRFVDELCESVPYPAMDMAQPVKAKDSTYRTLSRAENPKSTAHMAPNIAELCKGSHP